MLLDKFILSQLNDYANKLEGKLDGDVIFYYGPMHPLLVKPFRDLIERMSSSQGKHQRLCVFLRTGGGAVEPVEKMVDIIRHHYNEVWFFVPDFAMSAGTIFCMSGDKIFMDYSSSLGPIDPQVVINDSGIQKLVPASGVLEQVEKLIQKSREGNISPAEFAILQNQNLALLSSYEHARDLSIDLAKSWLVKYKFKDWLKHKTNPAKLDQQVTDKEKAERAEEIVNKLVDHKNWHSHGRLIGSKLLNDQLRLKIDDYPDDESRSLIRSYNDLITDFAEQKRFDFYMHDKTKSAEGINI